MTQEYWTFMTEEIKHVDFELPTRDAAVKKAEEWWATYCIENFEGMRDGETFSRDILLVKYRITDDNDIETLDAEESFVEYVHECGDICEHR